MGKLSYSTALSYVETVLECTKIGLRRFQAQELRAGPGGDQSDCSNQTVT